MANIHTMTVHRILRDAVIVIVHCPNTDSYVMSRPPPGWSVPYSYCTEGSWQKEAASLYRKMFGTSASKSLKLKKTCRIWHTDNDYLNTLVFYAEVDDGLLRGLKNDAFEQFEVISSSAVRELTKNKNLSPEVLDILGISSQGSPVISMKTNLVEITKDDLIFSKNSDSGINTFINSEISESDQLALYTFYLDSTFPFLKMDEIMMNCFMKKLGLIPFSSDHFRAADINNFGCIDFREVLGLIATLKNGTPKEKAGYGQRCKYVFRYYDKDSDDKLTLDEFKAILSKIAATKPNLNDNKLLLESIKQGTVTHDDLAEMVSTLKLRGMSTLLVNPSYSLAMRSVRKRSTSFKTSRDSTACQNVQGSSRPSCSLGGHIVTINPDGRIVTATIQNAEQVIKPDTTINEPLIAPSSSSMETFEGQSPATNVMSALKFFTENAFQATDDQSRWYATGFSDFPKDLMDCCNHAKLIFESEPRMLRIDSPVYIFGDVHGRYSDIVSFQKYFWNFGIECCPGSILFLGDYVDRGKNGVEVIAYLIAQKVKNRKKIFLLRGNHEIRKVQKEHTFFNESISKFEDGGELWGAINEMMDTMPLAALVDGQVFCCHGGIPMPSQCKTLDDINGILCPLKNPFDNKLAWALLWNDPQKHDYNSEKGKRDSNGFSRNFRRKTGHTFDKNALNFFIEKHKLSFVVRAHEFQDAGFHVDLDNRLITVFSSSNYKGNNNSGCVLVHGNKLRIFTIPPALPKEAPQQMTQSN